MANKIVTLENLERYHNEISQIIDNKQDAISDLTDIRSDASNGQTAYNWGNHANANYVKKTDLSSYATSTQLTDLSNKVANKQDILVSGVDIKTINGSPILGEGNLTIATGENNVQANWNETNSNSDAYIKNKPSIPTSSTIENWGFTKNTGTYSKPSDGIPKSDLSSEVQNSLSKADAAESSLNTLAERVTNVENMTSHDMRASVLWLGTSIPAGDINIDPQQNNTYPKMVADALGFDLYNMSKAGSFVAWYPQAPNWTTSAQVAAEFATAYSLSATRQEIYDKYYNVLETIRKNERLSTTWRDNYLNDFMDSSYETRILPYIDGTIAKCDGVVIDHGFNDRGNIFNVCNQHVTADKDSISVWGPGSGADGVEYPVIGGNAGWWWLTHLADGRYYDGEVYMNTVYAVANGLAGSDTGGMRGEFFGAMAYIIAKIQQVDPRIRIVIGNYFSQDYGSALGDGMNSFQTKYILQANQSIADYYGFPCVNVYKHTGLRNRTIRKPDGTTISDMYWFCPDGVHPSSDTTGLSNTIIASAYVAQIKGCFFKLG